MPKTDKRATIGQLFADNSDRLQRYLRSRLANEDDAQELAQEAYLRMLRIKRSSLVRHPQAYLYRIARNLVHELYTGQYRTQAEGVDVDTLETEELSPEEQAQLTVRRREVERVVRELSPKCRAALILHWRDGMTQVEIAGQLNLSRSMVQKYLATGLAHCRKRLRRYAEADRGDG